MKVFIDCNFNEEGQISKLLHLIRKRKQHYEEGLVFHVLVKWFPSRSTPSHGGSFSGYQKAVGVVWNWGVQLRQNNLYVPCIIQISANVFRFETWSGRASTGETRDFNSSKMAICVRILQQNHHTFTLAAQPHQTKKRIIVALTKRRIHLKTGKRNFISKKIAILATRLAWEV